MSMRSFSTRKYRSHQRRLIALPLRSIRCTFSAPIVQDRRALQMGLSTGGGYLLGKCLPATPSVPFRFAVVSVLLTATSSVPRPSRTIPYDIKCIQRQRARVTGFRLPSTTVLMFILRVPVREVCASLRAGSRAFEWPDKGARHRSWRRPPLGSSTTRMSRA